MAINRPVIAIRNERTDVLIEPDSFIAASMGLTCHFYMGRLTAMTVNYYRPAVEWIIRFHWREFVLRLRFLEEYAKYYVPENRVFHRVNMEFYVKLSKDEKNWEYKIVYNMDKKEIWEESKFYPQDQPRHLFIHPVNFNLIYDTVFFIC